MVVPWAATQLDREDPEQSDGCCSLLGRYRHYMVTLEVTGRKSGRTISLPVVMAIVDGQKYLLSMLGDDVHWVRNVRAAGGKAVLRSGSREQVQLEEIPADLQRAPGARPHVPVNKECSAYRIREGRRRISGLPSCSNKTRSRHGPAVRG
jgi:hypothetical protein